MLADEGIDKTVHRIETQVVGESGLGLDRDKQPLLRLVLSSCSQFGQVAVGCGLGSQQVAA